MRSSQPLNPPTAPIAARSATGRSSFLVGKLKYFRGGILSLLKTPSQTSCHFFVSTTPDGRTSQTINARDQNDENFHQIACTGSATVDYRVEILKNVEPKEIQFPSVRSVLDDATHSILNAPDLPRQDVLPRLSPL